MPGIYTVCVPCIPETGSYELWSRKLNSSHQRCSSVSKRAEDFKLVFGGGIATAGAETGMLLSICPPMPVKKRSTSACGLSVFHYFVKIYKGRVFNPLNSVWWNASGGEDGASPCSTPSSSSWERCSFTDGKCNTCCRILFIFPPWRRFDSNRLSFSNVKHEIIDISGPSSCQWWQKCCGFYWQTLSGPLEKTMSTCWKHTHTHLFHTGNTRSTHTQKNTCSTHTHALYDDDENVAAPSSLSSLCLTLPLSLSKSPRGVRLWPPTNRRNQWRAFFLPGGWLEAGCLCKCTVAVAPTAPANTGPDY